MGKGAGRLGSGVWDEASCFVDWDRELGQRHICVNGARLASSGGRCGSVSVLGDRWDLVFLGESDRD